MVRVKERFKLLRPVFVPFLIYLGALVITATWVEDHPESSLKMLVALLPLLPAIWIAFSLVGFMKKLDELEQRIINEAAAFSFMLTFLMLLTLTFWGNAGIDLLDPMFIIMFMVVFLLIGKVLGNRRYK